MHMRRKLLLLGALLVFVAFPGCRKQETAPLSAPQATQPETQASQISPTQIQEEHISFSYQPGSIGIYVTADPNLKAEPDALDKLTVKLSDKRTELTRVRVSDRQFDLIKNGHQAGGFVLVDIPMEMLEQGSKSWKDFEAAADALGRQVLSACYPAQAHICGGGHLDYGYSLTPYMTISFEIDNKGKQIHQIYLGEKYIYDFWHDTAYLADSGEAIMTTLCAEDIKPERNQAESWTIHDFSDRPK